MRFARTDQRGCCAGRCRWGATGLLVSLLVVGLIAGCENQKEPRRAASESSAESPQVATPAGQDTQVPTRPAGEESQAPKNAVKTTADAGSPEEQRQRSTNLYALHCAGCHGEKGNGVSVAGRFLFPKPRNFRAGRFRLIGTDNGIPSLRDLESVLV